jgi:septal ring factor EnvC (AmiA/AmiB activator)
MERDLALKEAYVKSLEREQDRLREEIGQVRERAAELFADLERSEARIVELGALAADIQRQTSYRMSVVAVRALRRTGPLFAFGRRGLRRLTGR